ncbi:MAG: UDP-glucose 4-epimerase GalE [Pseudomonadota bacterium]
MSGGDSLANRTILATGGLGYIGSHVTLDLLNAGANVVVLDNFSNAKPAVRDRIKRLSNRDIALVRGDVRDRDALQRLFAEHDIEAVVHFAGLKAVGESVAKPGLYYDVNINGSNLLFQEMAAAGCRRVVFSSSATVYGDPETAPVREDAPTRGVNPYGRSKLMVEHILEDLAAADARWSAICLRYFNPTGAHESGQIGEDPLGVPNNLFPFIAQVATGRREKLVVFGGDYPTPDGTGVRDFIHVVDLSAGHLAALRKLFADDGAPLGYAPINLGAGVGYSVLEALAGWSRACGRDLPYEIGPRRPGDVASVYADASLAASMLGWRAARGLDEMCRDHWRWQSENPEGYPEE